MKSYLGVDGGGTKTRFRLIDEQGRILASHLEGSAYYLEVGLERAREMLARGIAETLRLGGLDERALTYAFIGLPAYGEDHALIEVLDALPAHGLPNRRYRCGNDMVCGWAGALAGADGINVVCGTGSIAYGEYRGRAARAGGWGELFSDEGSSYWLAREGLRLFSRMSDGRAVRGPLYEQVRRHFKLGQDLDLCAAIYGQDAAHRSQLAQLSQLVTAAAADGDRAAQDLIEQAAEELADLVQAVHVRLEVPADASLPVTYSGGMFRLGERLTGPLRKKLERRNGHLVLTAPRFSPDIGAALQAARLHGSPLGAETLNDLEANVARIEAAPG